jgi:type VI secretion system secreted protein VgrG
MATFEIASAPKALKGAQLAGSLSGKEQISRPFEYRVRLAIPRDGKADAVVDPDDVLGQPFGVVIHGHKEQPRHFNGIVTEFTYEDFSGDVQFYGLVLRPRFWLLTRSSDCRVFQNKTTRDIVDEVLNGRVTCKAALNGAYKPWDYRVQYGETDFEFVSRLLEHEGIYYYFEHTANHEDVLVLTDDMGKHSAAKGYAEVPYLPETGAESQVRWRDKITAWHASKSFQAAGFASLEYNFETPAAALRAASPVPGRKDASKYELFEYPAGATLQTAAEVERIAKVRAEQLHGAQSVIRCKGDAVGLAVGGLFALTEHPRPSYNRKQHLIVATEIDFELDETRGTADNAHCHISIEAVPSNVPYRPERVTQQPRIHGTQTARVVGPQGKEIWTDKYGRVKVQFHWDRKGKSDDASSCWVRVASGWAGKNWGLQQIPRVGQEVVVSFLDGNPDRPLIIGSVYNAEQMPAYELPANATRSVLKSRSSADGTANDFNELRFEDKKGAEEIYLHAEKDLQVVIENNQTITVGATKKDKGDRTTTIQHDDKLSVGNDFTVAVTGKETRTVTKERVSTLKADDTLDVAKNYTLKAGDQITLECGMAKIVMKKDGTIEISGKDVKVKGTASASVDSTQTAVSGTQVDVKGTKTAVAGSGTLDLSSGGVASLKGSLTKIG